MKPITKANAETIKRGRPFKITLEERQYIRELSILGLTLGQIMYETGFSRTQISKIIKEPYVKGSWYIQDKNGKIMFHTYLAAAEVASKDGKEVHFSPDPASDPECSHEKGAGN